MRARATLAPPIVVQQVELVPRRATCWKGREAPCGGGWGGESESHPAWPGWQWLRVAAPGPRCPNLIPFYTSGRGSLGYAALQALLEASITGYLPVGGGTEIRIPVPSKPTCPKTSRPPPHLGLRESQSRSPSFSETQFLHFGTVGYRLGAGARAPSCSPRRSRPLPSNNAKAAAATAGAQRMLARGTDPSPLGAGRLHAWGGTQGAHSFNSPTPSGGGGA